MFMKILLLFFQLQWENSIKEMWIINWITFKFSCTTRSQMCFYRLNCKCSILTLYLYVLMALDSTFVLLAWGGGAYEEEALKGGVYLFCLKSLKCFTEILKINNCYYD